MATFRRPFQRRGICVRHAISLLCIRAEQRSRHQLPDDFCKYEWFSRRIVRELQITPDVES
jgi:hypothetical protein